MKNAQGVPTYHAVSYEGEGPDRMKVWLYGKDGGPMVIDLTPMQAAQNLKLQEAHSEEVRKIQERNRKLKILAASAKSAVKEIVANAGGDALYKFARNHPLKAEDMAPDAGEIE